MIGESVTHSAKWYYYNNKDVTEPMICKHYENLINSRFKESREKEKSFEEVRNKWGILNGENYYCKNCGEVVGYVELSEWEGFGKDDKAIMVREVVEEIEDELEDMLDNENKIFRKIISTMSALCNIKLTNQDYSLINNIFNKLSETHAYKPKDFKEFYIEVLKKSSLNTRNNGKINRIRKNRKKIDGDGRSNYKKGKSLGELSKQPPVSLFRKLYNGYINTIHI